VAAEKKEWTVSYTAMGAARIVGGRIGVAHGKIYRMVAQDWPRYVGQSLADAMDMARR
jgi:hypothetical protein